MTSVKLCTLTTYLRPTTYLTLTLSLVHTCGWIVE